MLNCLNQERVQLLVNVEKIAVQYTEDAASFINYACLAKKTTDAETRFCIVR